MADFAIRVASQGIQDCSIIATYIASLKDRNEDLSSIKQQAQGLESVFKALKESLTQASLDPLTSSATDQVSSSVGKCEAELNSLKQFVARFSDDLSPNARPQDKFIQQVQKLRYPLQKSDISRIQRSLGTIKETLDLALQNLGLRYSQLSTSKLINLEEASRQVSNSLDALDSDVSALGGLMSSFKAQIPTIQSSVESLPVLLNMTADRQLAEIQELHQQSKDAFSDSVSGLHTKLDGLLELFQQDMTTAAAAIGEPDPRTPVYKLASKPGNLAALCASLNYSENAMGTMNVLQAPTAKASLCPCRQYLIHNTKRMSWLSWDFWDNEVLRFEHYKGCKYFRSNGDERSRVRGLRLTGIVKNAIIVTFYTSTGAGGHSLGVNLEYYATVDRNTSPAFRVISVLEACMTNLRAKDVRQTENQAHWKRLALAANGKLESLFRMSKARAKDVDSSNESLLHAAAEVHPQCLKERDLHLRQTPFHLAAGNPECLRILVERSNPRLLAQDDKNSYTVLGYAILLSKTLCGQREDQDESSCQCTLPLRILLEGGCPIIPYRDFRSGYDKTVIAYASQHCKVHVAKSLLQRRQELKSIAQQYLSPLEIEKFGLHRPVALDIYAMQIDEILRHRGLIEFGPLTTFVEDGSDGSDGSVTRSPIQDHRSIYRELSTAEDADIYFNLGFHDITVSLRKPKRWQPFGYEVTYRISLPFVKWLLDHDAPLCEWVERESSPLIGYIADAFILAISCGEGFSNRNARKGDEKLVRELEERMLLDHSVDSYHCQCSPGGCTPFAVRMKCMQLGDDERDIATTFTTYLKAYGYALQREHYSAAIRFTTFHALGIAHTCICKEPYEWWKKFDAEEIAEIQDEYAELLELMESMTEEFEAHACEALDAATDELDSMITFWNGYWVRRMSEVLSELSQAHEASKSAAEDLGVIWGQPERETRREWEGWDYYFQRIKEIE
ncbi:hypothetical protein ACHAQJ_009748 [Trichoderma viride]